MSDNNSWKNVGEEIRSAITNALNTGNFNDLGDTVQHTIDYTVKEVTRTVSKHVSDAVSKSSSRTSSKTTSQSSRCSSGTSAKKPVVVDEVKKYPVAKIGSTTNIVYKILGGISLGVFGYLDLILLIASILEPQMITYLIVTLLLTLGSGIMIRTGISQGKRLKRALKYAELAGHNHYINLEDLALHTNQSVGKLKKDLHRMLKLGFFPEGHLDRREECLMLDDRIYREYLTIEKQRKEQPVDAPVVSKASDQHTASSATPEQSLELTAMIAQGRECIRQLREMNDHIPGAEISAKLFHLEALLKQIFERLEEHPEQLPQMKKFMNYYLPTTLKLVAAYEEFDSSDAHSQEIDEARAEIEKTLDTINSSFEELYARMFRDTAYDVTTDAKVLQTMLEKEGLGKGFPADTE